MCKISVETTNNLSHAVLQTGLESGSVAWAAYALSNPMGAIGGAIFGAVRQVTQYPLTWLSAKIFNANERAAATAAKTLVKAISFFGSFAAAAAVVIGLGYSFTAVQLVNVLATSMLTSIALSVILECFGMKVSSDALPKFLADRVEV